MKILVTGGAGFIGSHFVRQWLAGHPDDEVVTLDALTYSGVRANLDELAAHPRHRFLEGNICDGPLMAQVIRGCGLVVHFAAETHVDRSITDPSPFIRTNVLGTQTLLKAAVDLGVSRFVHVSTDEVYGPILQGAATEESKLNPKSPYAASKAAGDLLVGAYQETYRLPAIIVRPTNAYGPRQLPEKFIPLTLTNAMEQAPVPVYGDGQQRRAWLYVEDLARAVAQVAEAGEVGGIYNIASPWERANLDVAKAVLALLGQPASLLQFVQDRPGHDRRYAMQDARLRALGWQPRMDFDQGLRATIAWYQQHPDWWRPLKARLQQQQYHWLGSGARQAAAAVS